MWKEGRVLGGSRGADTSSCGTIALQRECDTLPVIPPRTGSLSGHTVTDGRHQTKVSKNWPLRPLHVGIKIPAASSSTPPCRWPLPAHTPISIDSLLWQNCACDAFPCLYASSVSPEEQRVRSQRRHPRGGRGGALILRGTKDDCLGYRLPDQSVRCQPLLPGAPL